MNQEKGRYIGELKSNSKLVDSITAATINPELITEHLTRYTNLVMLAYFEWFEELPQITQEREIGVLEEIMSDFQINLNTLGKTQRQLIKQMHDQRVLTYCFLSIRNIIVPKNSRG